MSLVELSDLSPHITCDNTWFFWGNSSNTTGWIYDQLETFNLNYQPYHTVLSLIICSFGVVANIITMVVFTRPLLINSVNVYLVGIAFCDGLVMASYLVFVLHYKLLTTEECDRHRYTFPWVAYTWLHANITLILHGAALWIGVALALVRYLMIRANYPSNFSKKSSTAILLFITFLSTLAFIPNYLSLKIERHSQYFLNCSYQLSSYEAYQLTYNNAENPQIGCWLLRTTFYTNGLLFKILPCSILTLLISMLIIVMCKANVRRKNLRLASTSNDLSYKRRLSLETDSTTRMLICLLMILLITEIPQGVLSLISGLSDVHFRHKFYENVADLLDLLSLTNSAINFPLYCVMSTAFRDNFMIMVQTPCSFLLKSFQVIAGKKPSQKVSLSTSLSRESETLM